MTTEREDELLCHLAAGTDLFTAIAATERKPSRSSRSTLIIAGCVVALIVVYMLL